MRSRRSKREGKSKNERTCICNAELYVKETTSKSLMEEETSTSDSLIFWKEPLTLSWALGSVSQFLSRESSSPLTRNDEARFPCVTLFDATFPGNPSLWDDFDLKTFSLKASRNCNQLSLSTDTFSSLMSMNWSSTSILFSWEFIPSLQHLQEFAYFISHDIIWFELKFHVNANSWHFVINGRALRNYWVLSEPCLLPVYHHFASF